MRLKRNNEHTYKTFHCVFIWKKPSSILIHLLTSFFFVFLKKLLFLFLIKTWNLKHTCNVYMKFLYILDEVYILLQYFSFSICLYNVCEDYYSRFLLFYDFTCSFVCIFKKTGSIKAVAKKLIFLNFSDQHHSMLSSSLEFFIYHSFSSFSIFFFFLVLFVE